MEDVPPIPEEKEIHHYHHNDTPPVRVEITIERNSRGYNYSFSVKDVAAEVGGDACDEATRLAKLVMESLETVVPK